MRTPTAVWILLCLPGATWAEPMRCGKWVVSEQSSPAEILEKCGEPQQKDVSRDEVYGKNALGSSIKLGVKVTERWRYQRSSSSLPMLVTVIEGKVVSLERTE